MVLKHFHKTLHSTILLVFCSLKVVFINIFLKPVHKEKLKITNNSFADYNLELEFNIIMLVFWKKPWMNLKHFYFYHL